MKSVLIIGLGKFGMHMARTFIENGHEVMGIDISEAKADGAADVISKILIGDATDERFLKGIGVRDFDNVIVTMENDFQTSLEITVLLKDLGCKYVVARANSPIHKKLLERNGADIVSYAEKEAAERLAISLGADNIFDYIELTEDIGIYEVAVPKGWIGRSIMKLDIRNRYKVNILATKEDGKLDPLPMANYEFKGTESLMIMGTKENVLKVK